MSQVVCMHICDAKALSVLSAVFEEAVNRKDHIATNQKNLLSCRK